MKKFLILLLVLLNNDPSEIAKTNRLKKEASKAFEEGNYKLAAEKFSFLFDSMQVTDDEIALNLAHSYYALKDSANAKAKYQSLTTSSNAKLKSIAYQQLGVMAKSPQTLKQSLAYLKSALKTDPANEGARYDYEVVKKLLEEQEKQNKDQNQDQQNQDQNQQNKDQDQKDQQKNDQQNQDQKDQQKQEEQNKEQEGDSKKENQDQEGEQEEQKQEEQKQQEEKEGKQKEESQEGEKKDKEEQNQDMSTRQKLEDMNISEQKAKMILEAMKNNEVQYIQQQKRKATKRPNSGKPDW